MGEKSTFFFKTWQLLHFRKVTSHLPHHFSHLLAQTKPCEALRNKILIFWGWWNYCQFLVKYDFKMCKKYVNGLFRQQGLFFRVCLHFLISEMQTPQHLFFSSCFFLLPFCPGCLSQAYIIRTVCALFSSVANIILFFTVWYFKKGESVFMSLKLCLECRPSRWVPIFFTFCCTCIKYCSLYCK